MIDGMKLLEMIVLCHVLQICLANYTDLLYY